MERIQENGTAGVDAIAVRRAHRCRWGTCFVGRENGGHRWSDPRESRCGFPQRYRPYSLDRARATVF